MKWTIYPVVYVLFTMVVSQNIHDKWFAALLAAVAILLVWIGRRLHWSVGLFTFYWLGVALLYLVFPESVLSAGLKRGYSLQDALVFRKLIGVGVVTTILLATPFLLLTRSTIERLSIGLGVVSPLLILHVLYVWWITPNGHFDAFGDRSSTLCMSMVLYPLWIELWTTRLDAWMSRHTPVYTWRFNLRLPVTALALGYPAAIFFVGESSTAIAALFTVLAVLWWRSSYSSLRAALGLVALLAVTAWAGWGVLAPDLVSGNGRFPIWEMGMKWWGLKANPWFGAGPYLWEAYGPSLQQVVKLTPRTLFVWMHSDWLQMLFGGGIRGVALLGVVVVCALRSAKRDTAVFAALAAYAVADAAQFFFHRPFSAAVGLFLLVRAFTPTEKVFSPEMRNSFEDAGIEC